MKTLIAALTAAVIAAAIAAGLAVRSAQAPDKADCLYAAAAAYPDWRPGQPRVTETVPECDGVPEADKQEIRQIMADYTSAALRNLDKS
jgi:hypothetical protein